MTLIGWKRTLVAGWCAALCFAGCSDNDPADSASDAGLNAPDAAAEDSGGPGPEDSGDTDSDATALCYEGWSGQSDCCLTDTARAAGPSGCAAGTFSASECGRLDPVCESVDLGSPPDMPGGDFAAAMLLATNAARSVQQDCGAEGMLGPVADLTPNAQLSEAAQVQADDMAATETVGITGSDGSFTSDRVAAAGYPGTLVAENVGVGAVDGTAVVDSWLQSPTTCKNLMGDQWTEVGFGLAQSAGGMDYWSQVFGNPQP